MPAGAVLVANSGPVERAAIRAVRYGSISSPSRERLNDRERLELQGWARLAAVDFDPNIPDNSTTDFKPITCKRRVEVGPPGTCWHVLAL